MIPSDVEQAKETLMAARDAAHEKVDAARAVAQEKVDAAAEIAHETAEKAANTAIRKIKSIKSKFFFRMGLGFVIFATLVLVTVSIATNQSLSPYFQYITNEKAESFKIAMDQKKSQISQQINMLAKSAEFQKLVMAENKYSIFSYLNVYRASLEVTAIHYTDNKGKVLYSSVDANGVPYNFTNLSVFETAEKLGKATEYVALDNRVVLLSVVRAYFSSKYNGFIVIENDLSNLANINYYKKLSNCEISVFIDNYLSGSSYIDEDMNMIAGFTVTDPVLLACLKTGEQTFGTSETFGKTMNTIAIPLGESDDGKKMIATIGQDVEAMNDTRNTVTKQAGFAILFGIILFIVVANFSIGRLVIKPIEKAYKAVHQLADESENADLTYRINLRGSDEIGALCEDVDIFLERQQNLITQLKTAQNNLDQIGSTLGESSIHTASAIAQIMANISGVRKQTDNQMECLNNANREVRGNEGRINSLDKMIENQSAGIVESSAAIEEMIGNINAVSQSVQKMGGHFKELVLVTQEGQTKQTEVDTKVTQMSEQSRLLMEANSVISRIASQTNLLAMNAAIEAAHAGEAGAGFSVVADEIRNLAENSSKQSHNISQELKGISKTITEVVEASTQSREAFRTITDKLSDTDNLMQQIDFAMREQDNASKQVLEALKDVNTSTSEVQTTAKEMKAGSDRVTTEMGKLTEVAETVLGSMNEMSAGATQINAAAQGVSEMSEKTMENITQMDSMLKRFVV